MSNSCRPLVNPGARGRRTAAQQWARAPEQGRQRRVGDRFNAELATAVHLAALGQRYFSAFSNNNALTTTTSGNVIEVLMGISVQPDQRHFIADWTDSGWNSPTLPGTAALPKRPSARSTEAGEAKTPGFPRRARRQSLEYSEYSKCSEALQPNPVKSLALPCPDHGTPLL